MPVINGVKPAEGSGALLWTNTVATATDEIIVPASVLGKKRYVLEGMILPGNASDSATKLYINADETDANYTQQWNSQNLTTHSLGRVASAAAGTLITGVDVVFTMFELVADAGHFHWINHASRPITSNTATWDNSQLWNHVTTVNTITAIKWSAPIADTFGVGSVIRLFGGAV